MNDWIRLTDFTVDCVVGVLEQEQCRTQPVEVAITLGMGDFSAAADTGDLSRSLDYAGVQSQATFLLQHGQWRLLEAASLAIARLLLAPPAPAERRAAVERVRIELGKPTILTGAVPRVGIERSADWCDLQPTLAGDGLWVDTLQQTPLTGAYRMHLERGAKYVHPQGAVSLLLAGRLRTLDGQDLLPGARIARGAGVSLQNPGSEPATLLTVSRPPLGR